MKEKKTKKKIKKAFRKTLFAGLLLALTLTSVHPATMYYCKYSPESFPQYKYEASLIEEGDRYNKQRSLKDYVYYKKAMDLIREKQNKIGEGKDLDLDFLRAYSVYSMAKAPPEPEYAEPYLLKARELAKKYYEIWKNPVFLDLYVVTLENLGYIYFDTAEDIRKERIYLVLLSDPTSDFHGIRKDRIIVDVNDLPFLSKYSVRKIIGSKNFTEILHYYKIAKKYYEEYLKFYEENEDIEKIIKEYPNVAENYEETNKRVLSHLKTIDEILSKYDPNYKKEETKENQIKGPTEKKRKNKN